MGIGYVSGISCPPFKANEYREGKLKLLKDFDITLTESERETFNTLTSPREIDKFYRDIIRNNRW
jgi:hypothetical protein